MLLALTCLECSEKILNIDKSDHNENGYFCDLDCSEQYIINKVQKVNRKGFYDYPKHNFIVLPHGRGEFKGR